MMRQVVSTLTGILMALYFIYFAVPMIYTEHNSLMTSPLIINSTDPTVVTSFNLGSGFYTILPLIPILVGCFVIINVSLKRDAGD